MHTRNPTAGHLLAVSTLLTCACSGEQSTQDKNPSFHLTTSNCDSRGQLNSRCTLEGGDKVLRIVGAD